MKILFICGSLEPGRDGVGDYTRRLAGECAARGHGCTVIALHDPAATRRTDATEDSVRLLRLPATESWPDRLACAGQYLRSLAPDWVSWQLVAYGFHPRGFLPAALLRGATALRGPRCHVMLHELWLGLEAGAGWRERAIGWLQRRGVLCLLDQLDPDRGQTSNAAYQFVLQREGFDVSLLGLFGNVPIADRWPDDQVRLTRWLPAPAGDHAAAPLVALTFGTLHPQWQPAATVTWLVTTAARLRRAPVVIAIGRAGAHAAAVLQAFRQQGVTVAETGELASATISHLLRAADLGLAAHPWVLIDKSGAAAAMLEHGLPVLVPRDDWQLRDGPGLSSVASDPLLVRLVGLGAARTDHWLARRHSPKSALPRIADAFLASLGRPSPDQPTLAV
jgi:hypothetical protein